MVPLNGLDFIEYASPNPENLEALFTQLGFVKTAKHKNKELFLYQQGAVNFIVNREPDSFAKNFMEARQSPCVCSIAFRVRIPSQSALEILISRGAKKAEPDSSHSFPAIYGVGDSLIHLVDDQESNHWIKNFSFTKSAVQDPYLIELDHLTHNVPLGQMDQWCDFYSELFDFKERRFFDIQGLKTGLRSKVMKSPCNSISIPINEPSPDEKGKKSQIQEYLDEYHGAGIQHIALLTRQMVPAIEHLKKKGLQFLETPSTYYEALKSRLPILKEDVKDLERNQILADGDDSSYLLQIFTKNVIGPIFLKS